MLIEKQILDFKLYLDSEDFGISRNLSVNGIHEKPSVDYLKTILRPEMNVLDLGANIGFYLFIEAGIVNHVYAIEPVKYTYDILIKNINLNNFKNISTYQLAIGNYNGIVDIYSGIGLNNATIIKEYAKGWGSQNKGVEEVPISTLDNFIETSAIGQIDLLRMDVEGAEVDIISGGLDTLNNMPKDSYLVIETHSVCLQDKSKLGVMLDQIAARGFMIIKATTWQKDLELDNIRNYIVNDNVCPQVFFKKC